MKESTLIPFDSVRSEDFTETEILKVQTSFQKEIGDLLQKIESVDQEYKKAEKKLQRIDEVTRKLTKKRSDLKNQTMTEQNEIFKLEEKLTQIAEDQYRTEIPDFLRPLIAFLTGIPDEINLRTKISKL